jgi:hypothetical protein
VPLPAVRGEKGVGQRNEIFKGPDRRIFRLIYYLSLRCPSRKNGIAPSGDLPHESAIRESDICGRYVDSARVIFYTSRMLKIAVVDGQGGGIGNLIVKRLREEFREKIDIIALGTNAAATTAMMKARANRGATGENAIVWNSARVDLIVGPLSIALPDAMLGEVTAKMASAVVSSGARTILLPLNQEGIEIVGVGKEPLPHVIEKVITMIAKEIEHV